MQLYNFNRLIHKYSADFTVTVAAEGHYEGGVFVEGKRTVHDFVGAVIPVPERKVYTSGGHYTSQDRELYMLTRIPSALLSGRVTYQGHRYSIEEETDYAEFANVFRYVLKREADA